MISVDLDYANIALYAFEAVSEEKLHIVDTNAESAYAGEAGLVIRATESGDYYAQTSDGNTHEYTVEVPEAYDITGWDLTVESWDRGRGQDLQRRGTLRRQDGQHHGGDDQDGDQRAA